MTSDSATLPATLYPKRYWSASTTWQAWNKLTAFSIHHSLRTEPGFEGQHVYFFGNHPIQYVRVVGVVVGIEQYGRFTVLTLDDSSGECIDVKITRKQVMAGSEKAYASDTGVEGLKVCVSFGLMTVQLHGKAIVIGDVVEAKGTISVFRNNRQIELKRMSGVLNTIAEAAAWAKTAKWMRDLQARPWLLTRREMDDMDEKTSQEARVERTKTKSKRDWKAKVDDDRLAREAVREAKRKRAEARFNKGALKGSSTIPAPWE
ncbi:hypothetical protein LTR53_006970 [Teratosphaeriaceae sp. CCFEE 6253]|nr:hypothetical protein LTR53_006970 [Teratosphaeriaceae sp. CCFEE 6253]